LAILRTIRYVTPTPKGFSVCLAHSLSTSFSLPLYGFTIIKFSWRLSSFCRLLWIFRGGGVGSLGRHCCCFGFDWSFFHWRHQRRKLRSELTSYHAFIDYTGERVGEKAVAIGRTSGRIRFLLMQAKVQFNCTRKLKN